MTERPAITGLCQERTEAARKIRALVQQAKRGNAGLIVISVQTAETVLAALGDAGERDG